MLTITENSEFSAPTLQAEHIYLRTGKTTDFDAIKAYRQDEENCRYIRPAEDDATTLKMVEQLSSPWQLSQGRWNGLVICQASNNEVIGEVAFNIEDWTHQRAEIGYRLTKTASGKGYCTQACLLLIDFLFKEFGFVKLVAKCDPRNIASYKVMEKLGFVREGHFKHHYLLGSEWTDQYDYGLLATNWLAQQAQ